MPSSIKVHKEPLILAPQLKQNLIDLCDIFPCRTSVGISFNTPSSSYTSINLIIYPPLLNEFCPPHTFYTPPYYFYIVKVLNVYKAFFILAFKTLTIVIIIL